MTYISSKGLILIGIACHTDAHCICVRNLDFQAFCNARVLNVLLAGFLLYLSPLEYKMHQMELMTQIVKYRAPFKMLVKGMNFYWIFFIYNCYAVV